MIGLLITMAKPGEGSVTSSPARRHNEGSVAPSRAALSSFFEMLKEERESERKAWAAERQAWAAEERRLMDEVIELRV